MGSKRKTIIREYHSQKNEYIALGDLISSMLKEAVKKANIDTLAIEHRVKSEKSLCTKLDLKGDKYSSIDDITDVLGARIICFYCDDVDKVANVLQGMFEIDWENSVDRREVLNPDSFGYLSLHYIASLPKEKGYPENFLDKKFEIQIRSILQHTWAAINHDLGYKTQVDVPRSITRDLSKVAGLLEFADDQFVNIRDRVKAYGEDIKNRIANNEADDVLIDLVSLREFVQYNKDMIALVNDMAGICDARVNFVEPGIYVRQLAFLGIKTIGDLETMLSENRELALALARKSLEKPEIDNLSTNNGFRFLCRAELLNKNYPIEKIVEFINLSLDNEKRAGKHAMHLMKTYNQICEEL